MNGTAKAPSKWSFAVSVSHSTFEIDVQPQRKGPREPLPGSANRSLYCRFGKRALDVLMASVALILLSPLFLLIALLVRATSNGPALHRENRVGRDARIFPILKFRTTAADAEQDGWAIGIEEEEEVTHFGRILRALNLDELPQLWNVLRGDMSLVGPRPEIPSYVAAYTRQQLRVLTVRPGMADVAWIQSRREEPVLTHATDREEFYRRVLLPEKLLLNLEYIDRASFRLDMKVIAQKGRSIFGAGRVREDSR